MKYQFKYKKEGKDYFIRKDNHDLWKATYYDVVNKMENDKYFESYREGIKEMSKYLSNKETDKRLESRRLLENFIKCAYERE